MGQQSLLTLRSLYAHALGLHHYSINSLLYLRTICDKYIALYRESIIQLQIYATMIRILSKGYLPNTLVTPLKLKEILNEVRSALRITNPDYDLVIGRLHLYYDLELVTFGIDGEKNLIIQFPVFIQPYTQQPLILYQLEQCQFQSLTKTHRWIHTQNYKLKNHTLHWIQKLTSHYRSKN